MGYEQAYVIHLIEEVGIYEDIFDNLLLNLE